MNTYTCNKMKNSLTRKECRRVHNQLKNQEALKRKQREAKIRRNEVEKWEYVASLSIYKRAVAKEVCYSNISKIKHECFDGIFLNLNCRNSKKSYSVQKRILRRIVEKRQAQSVHRNVKRSDDKFVSHLVHSNMSRSMNDIYRYQHCS